jgi:DNA-binding XRE family transcriptional regulator
MPRLLKFGQTVPYELEEGALHIGERITLDRKRRSLTLRELASKAGISYSTARSVENGNLQTSLEAYLAVLWAMGLESEFPTVATP